MSDAVLSVWEIEEDLRSPHRLHGGQWPDHQDLLDLSITQEKVRAPEMRQRLSRTQIGEVEGPLVLQQEDHRLDLVLKRPEILAPTRPDVISERNYQTHIVQPYQGSIGVSRRNGIHLFR